jgi:hypothetical protein
MTDAAAIVEQAPLQDRDLLLRLGLYFDGFDQRLRHGEGWFIFNAAGGRLQRISSYIEARLHEDFPQVYAYCVPWRDFAISAYVDEVALRELEPGAAFPSAPLAARREYDLARQVTEDTRERLHFSDVLVLVGLKPSTWHEATYLDTTIEERYRRRLATILLTPHMPHHLEAGFEQLDPSGTFWPRLFQRMYATSLVAL